MFEKNTPRLILIGVVLLWAFYSLYPTFRYQILSPRQINEMRQAGTLDKLEKKMIRLGLDLKGGMHIVLEADIPVLVENLASNKNELFYELFHSAREKSEATGEDFIPLFVQEAESRGVKLHRHFPELAKRPEDVQSALEEQSRDAINRILEILQNRVDQFGVAEPTIQKQGNKRVIIELAGIEDPERARDLLQSTAKLEFVLLKDPALTQDLLTRMDDILKGSQEKSKTSPPKSDEKIEPEDTTKIAQSRQAQEKEIPLSELFEKTMIPAEEAETTGVIVDEELFKERPFSSLLRNVGGDLGVPIKNVPAVKRILEMEEVRNLLNAGDARLAWSHDKEIFSTSGGEETFYRLYHLEKEAGLTGGVIEEANATLGSVGSQAGGQSIVSLAMNSEGAKTWSRLTGANVGKRVTITLDGKVHMAPVIRTKISDGRTQIEGFASMDEAKDIAIVLRAGALPAPVNIIEERTVGPSLGHDSIHQGTQVIIIGLMSILIFMVVYYRLSGLIADFALVWNLFLVLAIMATLKATLTLPGLAGLALTAGMSVDANVIIFERIREELEKGKTVRSAIDNGFSRALTAIIDSNLTTIFAALVLMQFGTGPIKGFAIVLFWGVTISMFTAIFLTRTIFNLITSRGTLKTLSI